MFPMPTKPVFKKKFFFFELRAREEVEVGRKETEAARLDALTEP